jgi:hypothetical protein
MTSFYSEMMKGLGASTRLWYLTDRQPSIPVETGCESELVNHYSAISQPYLVRTSYF